MLMFFLVSACNILGIFNITGTDVKNTKNITCFVLSFMQFTWNVSVFIRKRSNLEGDLSLTVISN